MCGLEKPVRSLAHDVQHVSKSWRVRLGFPEQLWNRNIIPFLNVILVLFLQSVVNNAVQFE